MTRENYGKQVQVIPIKFSRSRVFFKSRKDGGGVLCSSSNGNDGGILAATCEACDNSKWGSRLDDKGQPGGIACTEFKNYPCLLVKEDGTVDLISVSMKSTAIKVAKRWNSFMRMLRIPKVDEKGVALVENGKPVMVPTAAMFEGAYNIRTVEEKNAKGTYFNYGITPAGFISRKDPKWGEALAAYDQFKARGVEVDMSGLDESATPPGDSGPVEY